MAAFRSPSGGTGQIEQIRPSERCLRIALVGPFPPPYGGMASYFGLLRDGILSQSGECYSIALFMGNRAGLWRRVDRSVAFVSASFRLLRERADLVHCITGSRANLLANVLPLLAARLSLKPSVLSISGGDFPGTVRSLRGMKRTLLRRLLLLPARVIACNTEIAEALAHLRLPAERVLLITNALPFGSSATAGEQMFLSELDVFTGSHQPVIVSVSARYEFYGSLDLVQAFAGLRQEFPRAGLILIFKAGGDQKFIASFNAAIDRYNLSDHLKVLENIPSVDAALRKADVFVRTPHTDGDSISVREALALGLPVVATDVGYRPPGVIVYRVGDVGDLLAQLQTVLAGANRVKDGLRANSGEGEENLHSLWMMYHQVSKGK